MKKNSYTEQQFIDQAIQTHSNKYSYTDCNFIKVYLPATITCTTHGKFTQIAGDHLRGHGCSKCGPLLIAAIKNAKAKLEFVGKAKAKHCNRYSYTKTVYVLSRDKVIITCSIHGDFTQTPNSHLHGCGCLKCAIVYRANMQSKRALLNHCKLEPPKTINL